MFMQSTSWMVNRTLNPGYTHVNVDFKVARGFVNVTIGIN